MPGVIPLPPRPPQLKRTTDVLQKPDNSKRYRQSRRGAPWERIGELVEPTHKFFEDYKEAERKYRRAMRDIADRVGLPVIRISMVASVIRSKRAANYEPRTRRSSAQCDAGAYADGRSGLRPGLSTAVHINSELTAKVSRNRHRLHGIKGPVLQEWSPCLYLIVFPTGSPWAPAM